MNFLKYKRDKGRRDKGKEGGNKREKEVGKNGGREGKKGEREEDGQNMSFRVMRILYASLVMLYCLQRKGLRYN